MKNKISFFFFCLFFLLGCCSIPTHLKISSLEEEKNINLINRLENSSVALLEATPDGSKYLTFCGGVFITPDLILSARHCGEGIIPGKPELTEELLNKPNKSLDDLLKIINILGYEPNLDEMIGAKVYFKTFSELATYYTKENPPPKAAEIIKYDPGSDLMLLKTVNYSSEYFSEISESNGRIGGKAHIVGHPARVEFTYFSGNISGFRAETFVKGKEQYFIHITAPVYMGNSGGGAFDNNGSLLGICSFFRKNVPNMSFFVDAETIKNFLNN